MHPTIATDLVKTHINDLQAEAERARIASLVRPQRPDGVHATRWGLSFRRAIPLLHSKPADAATA
jgi:hypothetical protein